MKDIQNEGRPLVVVIDDDQFALDLIKLMLGKTHRVKLFLSSSDGLGYLMEYGADLVIIDLMMSNSDGIDLIETLQLDERTTDIPIVVISGVTDQEKINTALNFGAAEFVAKPFSMALFSRVIEKYTGVPLFGY